MIITKQLQQHVCGMDESIITALNKINDSKGQTLYVVSENGILHGTVTDGDIRRYLIESKNLSLDTSVSECMNSKFTYVKVGYTKSELKELFKNGVSSVPIVDENFHLHKICTDYRAGFYVGQALVSNDSPAFIIAEIGNNHQGDINLAKELVDHAVNANVDCVKFQMRNMKKLYKNDGNSNDDSADLGAQYTLDLLSMFQLSNQELFEVFDYAKEKGVLPLCTPWDLDSLTVLEEYGMPAYKVASADFTNYELLAAIAKTGKPFFCSTGMSSEAEIKDTIKYLNSIGGEFAILHCNSTYPTPFKDVNLNYLTRLKKISGELVGYSGHERGISVPIASIALGACVIEKHLTIDKTLEGTDHKVSLLPSELKAMVEQIREVEESMGPENEAREITQGELINRENLAKSLVAKRAIHKGQKITRDDVEIKSPGQGLQPNSLHKLVGIVANRNIKAGGFFFKTDIYGQIIKRSDYKFSRPFGVPVRYHDYTSIVKDTNLDFVEFHLSYKDLKVELNNYFDSEQGIGFAVHAPELFENDHILDLASYDNDYRQHSIKLLQSVIEITKEINKFFPKTKKPVIVVNAGGWNGKGFLDQATKIKKYELVAQSIKKLDLTGVTLSIQTMPPFPWHFGGQSFHNLFVDADEMVDFCKQFANVKICLDVSHSMMACNYYGWDLYDFVEKIAPYNVHMHIVDAKGVDGEGVKVGEGDVDFSKLSSLLKAVNPNIQFIPEVWQGHKNGGEGFWEALEFLETMSL